MAFWVLVTVYNSDFSPFCQRMPRSVRFDWSTISQEGLQTVILLGVLCQNQDWPEEGEEAAWQLGLRGRDTVGREGKRNTYRKVLGQISKGRWSYTLLLQSSVALRSFSMLLYVIKCAKEVKKLACEAIIPSVPKCLVNTERFWVWSDSALPAASRGRQSWRKLTKNRGSLMRALFLPGPKNPANHLWAHGLPLENKPSLRAERISRCYLSDSITIGLNRNIYLTRHPRSPMRPTK